MMQQVTERRVKTREVVEKLIKERQEMLVLYCEVAGLEPYNSSEPVTGRLQKFCQVMVDYIALGHFEVYERITKGTERRRSVTELAAAVYPFIEKATQKAVDFNDRYASEDQCTTLESLADDLSKLGEDLALRIEYEDRLIAGLIGKERVQSKSYVAP
jgi:regulator of sigma D